MATVLHSLAGGLNATSHRTWVLTPRLNAEDGSDGKVLRLSPAAWKVDCQQRLPDQPGHRTAQVHRAVRPGLVPVIQGLHTP